MIGVLLTCSGGWLPCLEIQTVGLDSPLLCDWLVGLSVFVEDTQNGMVVMWLVIQLIVILSLNMMFDG